MTDRNEIDPVDGQTEGQTDGEADSDTVNIARREALLRMGTYAGLTAPVVVTLLTSNASEAWAASSSGGGGSRGSRGSRRERRRQAMNDWLRRLFSFFS